MLFDSVINNDKKKGCLVWWWCQQKLSIYRLLAV